MMNISLPELSWFSDTSVLITHLPCVPCTYTALLTSSNPELFTVYTVRVGLDHILIETRIPDPNLLDIIASAVSTVNMTIKQTLPASPVREIVIPTIYDGEDLTHIAAVTGCSVNMVISAHMETLWEVAMLGFAPGFAYLTVKESPVDWWNNIHRLPSPRRTVPQGSVAVTSGMTAVYPQDMPGGWNLIGRTNLTMFNAENVTDPTLLHPTDLIRFIRTEPS